MLKCLNAKMESGVSLYLALTIMTILLSLALGISTIFLGQTSVIRAMGYSVAAFYAADAGIEAILVDRDDPFSSPAASCTEITPCYLSNGAKYYLNILLPGGNCSASYYCIESAGSYKETRRVVKVSY